jgi:hypothetical protein
MPKRDGDHLRLIEASSQATAAGWDSSPRVGELLCGAPTTWRFSPETVELIKGHGTATVVASWRSRR